MNIIKFPKRLYSNFFEYLKYFLLLSLLIIILIGGMQAYLLYQSYEDTAIKNGKNTLTLLKNAHEILMSQIENSTNSIYSNPLLINYMQYYYNKDYTALIYAQNQLERMVVNSKFIKSICIYYPKQEYTLSSDLGVAKLHYYHNTDFLTSLKSLGSIYNLTVARDVNYINTNDSVAVITKVQTLPIYYTAKDAQAFLIIDIDIAYIENALKEINDRTNAYILITDENNNTLASVGKSDYFDGISLNLINDDRISYEITNINDEDMLVLSTMSAENNWKYIYIEPMAEVTGGFNDVIKLFLWVCVLALMVSIIISLILSYRIFKPINNIYNKFTQFLEGDSYIHKKETDRIMQHFDDIIAENEQNQSENKIHALIERINQFSELLHTESDIASIAFKELGLTWTENDLFLLLLFDVEYKCDEEFIEQLRYDLSFIDESLKPLFAATIAKEEAAVLICISTNADKISVYDIAYTLQRVLKKDCSIGLSTVFADNMSLSMAYRQAREALDMRIMSNGNTVTSFEELSKIPFLPYPISIENNIFIALKSNNWDELIKAVNSFEGYLLSKAVDANTIRIFYLQLYCSSEKLIFNLSETPGEWIRMNHFDLISMTSIKNMTEFMLSLFWDTMKNINSFIHVLNSRKAKEICEYINSHLAEDLSIKTLGGVFSLNQITIRKIFKEELNITMKNYIDLQRIEIAKDLLINSDIMIMDLAAKLGFWHSQSFIAFFKKKVGMTPGEYKMVAPIIKIPKV